MNERTLFLEALDRTDPASRAAYLNEACQDDTELRQRVEALLRSHESGGSFLHHPAVEPTASAVPTPDAMSETSDSGPPPDAEAGLDFLGPSSRTDALGRLDHYDVLGVVGRGGMGIVLRAFDEKLHRVVALKVMARDFTNSAEARKRFTREAKAAAAVVHDHIVPIHAIEDRGPVPYLVMQFIEGKSLQQKINDEGSLEVKEILRIGLQAARGLAGAHRQGLVHRDIKPANLLLENGVQRVKITDFGLARLVDDATRSQSGVISGTPQYMSPEQADGQPVDHRSDLFSLGSVLYAMCTGRPPFRAESTVATLKRVCDAVPRPIRELNPDIPESLCSIIAKLHAKRPEERYQSAQEVAEILEQQLAGLQLARELPVSPAAASPPRVANDDKETLLEQERKPWAALGWALGLGGFALLRFTTGNEVLGVVLSLGGATLLVQNALSRFRGFWNSAVADASSAAGVSAAPVNQVSSRAVWLVWTAVVILVIGGLIQLVSLAGWMTRGRIYGWAPLASGIALGVLGLCFGYHYFLTWAGTWKRSRRTHLSEPTGSPPGMPPRSSRGELLLIILPFLIFFGILGLLAFQLEGSPWIIPAHVILFVAAAALAPAVFTSRTWREQYAMRPLLSGAAVLGLIFVTVLGLVKWWESTSLTPQPHGRLIVETADESIFFELDHHQAKKSQVDNRRVFEWTLPEGEYYLRYHKLTKGLHTGGFRPFQVKREQTLRLVVSYEGGDWRIDEVVNSVKTPDREASFFVPLFNGRDLAGWTTPAGQDQHWEVRDGILAGSSGALLWTTRNYRTFHLRFEARTTAAESLVVHAGQPSALGENHLEFKLEASRDWARYQLVVMGNTIYVKRNEEEGHGKYFWTGKFESGPLGLAGGTLGRAEFRNVEIYDLEFKPELFGRWDLVSAEYQGKPVDLQQNPDQFPRTMILSAGQYGLFWGKQKHEGTLRVDSNKSPAEMDFSGSIFDALKPRKMIFELKGEQLKLCLPFVGPKTDPPRPTEFKTGPESKNAVLIYERRG
jgi:uncharacterized protein (TIGR03067 family)